MTRYFVPLVALLLSTVASGADAYKQASGASLRFVFMQAGAESEGAFRTFDTALTWDEKNPAAGSLKVIVQIASLDSGDKDRDATLRSADLFDAAKYPTAQFVSDAFTKRADGQFEAAGKLTMRGVTRAVKLPLAIRATPDGVELQGSVTLQRLDFGVGQGDWKSTEWIGNDVKVHYKVPLTRSR